MTKLSALASTVFILSLSIPSGPADAQSCASLRQACLMKDSLGEQGQGNCKRFRQRCGGGGDVFGGGGGDVFGGGGGINCNQLRNACMFKNEIGQRGEGNCKRFRQFCSEGRPMFKRSPEVVRLPRRQQKKMHVCYTLIVSSGETFGPFKSDAQAVMFAAVRWPGKAPAWHIERHSYEER